MVVASQAQAAGGSVFSKILIGHKVLSLDFKKKKLLSVADQNCLRKRTDS